MHSARRPLQYTLSLILLLGALSSNKGWANSEDICQFKYEGDPTRADAPPLPINPDGSVADDYFNCYEIRPLDGNGGLISGLYTYLEVMQGVYHARSSLHFDATYLLALAAGASYHDAMRIATSSQAIDLNRFIPVNKDGIPIESVAPLEAQPTSFYDSGNLSGLNRMSWETGGYAFHFVPWLSENKFRDTLYFLMRGHLPKYDKDAETDSPLPRREVPLNHYRKWAFEPGSPLCMLGLTNADGSCFDIPVEPAFQEFSACHDRDWEAPPNSAKLNLMAYYIFPVNRANAFWLGEQKFQAPVESSTEEIQGSFLKDMPEYNPVVQAASPEALGVYLHALTDRISHNLCTNQARIKATNRTCQLNDIPENERECHRLMITLAVQGNSVLHDYELNYPPACGQLIHAKRHLSESGNKALPPRTTYALELTYWEIEKWLKQNGRTSEPKHNSRAVIHAIKEAMKVPEAQERVLALCSIAESMSRPYFDGKSDCNHLKTSKPPSE